MQAQSILFKLEKVNEQAIKWEMSGLMSKKDLLSVCCQGLTGKKNYIYL